MPGVLERAIGSPMAIVPPSRLTLTGTRPASATARVEDETTPSVSAGFVEITPRNATSAVAALMTDPGVEGSNVTMSPACNEAT
jgi:hypothetical protein